MCKNVLIATAPATTKQCGHIMPCTKNYTFNNKDAWTKKEAGVNGITRSLFEEVLDLLVPSYSISIPKNTKGTTKNFICFAVSKNTSDA